MINQIQQNSLQLINVWNELRPKLGPLLKWVTIHCFVSVYLRIYNALISNTHPRKIFGGSSLNRLHLITIPLLVDKPQSFLKSLRSAGELITQTWGRPPLKFNVNLIGITLAAFSIILSPLLITLAISTHPNALIIVGLTCSAIALLIYSTIHKSMCSFVNYVVYNYAKDNTITSPLSEKKLKNILIEVFTDEKINETTS